MKKELEFLKGLGMALFMAIAFSSCDPCAELTCDNGTCNNGTCVCDTGYFLNGKNCAGVNLKFVGTGTATATQLWVDNQGASTNPPDVTLSLTASTTNPYQFTLLRFNNQIKNDIVFTVSTSDSEVLVSANNVSTSAGNTYNISGAKVGSQVTLTIREIGGTTYTLQYSA